MDFVNELASAIHKLYTQNDPVTAWDRSKKELEAHIKRLTIESYMQCIQDFGVSHRAILNEMKKRVLQGRD